MKLHLPISLLVLASAATLQADDAEKYYRFGKGIYQRSGNTGYLNTADLGLYYSDTNKPDSSAPSTIVFGGPERIDTADDYPFDGGGTVVIKKGEPTNIPSFAFTDTPVAIDRVMVVREGTLLIDGAHIENHNKLNDAVSNLLVGGQGAHLVLDNGASYVQKVEFAGNSVSAIAIGSGDGKGKVTLNNGSTLHTDHFVFAGYRKISNGYVSWTERDGSGDGMKVRYADENTPGFNDRDEIYINSGSTLSAGTSLQFANVDVVVSGKGADGKASVLSDNMHGRDFANLSLLSDPSSYLGYNGETTIKAEDGGRLEFNWNVSTGFTKTADGVSGTKITVTGEGSAISVAGEADFGGGESWWHGSENEDIVTKYGYTVTPESAKSDTQVIIEKGGIGEFNQVRVGKNTAATLTVNATSSIVSHADTEAALLEVCAKGSVENSGNIGIDTLVSGGELTAKDGSVFTNLVAQSGTLYLEGDVTINGTLSLGSALMTFAANNTAEEGLIVYLNDGTQVTATDGITLGNNLTLMINVEDTADIINKTYDFAADGTDIDGLENAKYVFTDGTNEVEAAVRTNADGTVTVTGTIPEPTTATLSLLALAALATRRRRK